MLRYVTSTNNRALVSLLAAIALLFPACDPVDLEDVIDDPQMGGDNDFPLSSREALFADAPDNDTLDELGKADAVYPELFQLVESQTPARNQGRRGTCSIFAAVGLMEHLYILAGWPGEPNFSEQYLQWSTKEKLFSFRNTDGSNTHTNLRAINLHGIPQEVFWPYESFAWNSTHHEECTGEDDQPVFCYTNGEPPEAAANAAKYKLPFGRWINRTSIKPHMTATRTAVVASVPFFYQSWNHGGSKLVTNSDYSKEGYVTYPNAEDKADSEERPAGHAVLIVGWDDNLEVHKRDSEGELILDEEGNPEVERGFYIFKNSWGTGRFGVNNPWGDGYGYISKQYIEEYATVYGSRIPEDFEPPVEICDDGIDNTGNGLIDCDDPACADSPACVDDDDPAPPTEDWVFNSDEEMEIPDNDAEGITSEIVIENSGEIVALVVGVDISHSWIGDLKVTMKRDDIEVVLHDRTGSSQEDLYEFWVLEEFDGMDMVGTWTLHVADLAPQDTGMLNNWWMEILTVVEE